MPTCGVYKITNLVNGKVYYGSSRNVGLRFSNHRSRLRRGNHHNIHLQRSWDMYGEPSFEFQVVEECSPEVRLQLEGTYIMSLPKELAYNQGGTVCGTRAGQKNTPEHNARISAAQRGVKGKGAGIPHPWSWKGVERNRASHVAKLGSVVEAHHQDGRVMTFTSVRDAARTLSCPRQSIQSCLRGRQKSVRPGWTFCRVPKQTAVKATKDEVA